MCCLYSLITWHIPPLFLSNLVQIMRWELKYSPHLVLHSWLNCIFSVASFRTLDAGWLAPVLPQPATTQLMLAGFFPSFLGNPMGLMYLFSVAFFFNCNRWKKNNNKSINYSSCNFDMCLYFMKWTTLRHILDRLTRVYTLYLEQHNVIIQFIVFWMWVVLCHVYPLLTFLSLANVMCSKHHRHGFRWKTEEWERRMCSH